MTTRTPLSAYDVTGRYRFPSLMQEAFLTQEKCYAGTTNGRCYDRRTEDRRIAGYNG
ncbi:MAG: hypothetical protein AB9879_10465 [Methanothrix sp.]